MEFIVHFSRLRDIEASRARRCVTLFLLERKGFQTRPDDPGPRHRRRPAQSPLDMGFILHS